MNARRNIFGSIARDGMRIPGMCAQGISANGERTLRRPELGTRPGAVRALSLLEHPSPR